MKSIHIAIVHGIGTPAPGYAKPLISGLTEKFNRNLQNTLKSSDDFRPQIKFQEVIWDDVVAINQKRLAELLKKGFNQHKPTGLRAIASKVFSFLTSPILKLRTDFAAEAISDILGYYNDEAYTKIHARLLAGVQSLVQGNEKEHLSFIAHSLGTVITSDFVYDQQKKQGSVHPNFNFCNFFTLGSPVALFALQYGVELFKSPIRVEDQTGQWINIFDLDDPVAYPLKNLNEAYDKAVSADREVSTGGFGVSHIRYFENDMVQQVIAEKLTKDWLFLNGK